MRRRPDIPSTLIVALLATGCLGGGTAPPTHHYILQVPGKPPTGSTSGLHIGVTTLEVDPPYDQNRLVYRASPDASEVGFYNYHRWAAPLGRLVASGVATGLTGTPGVASAEPVVAGADYDALLFGRVIYLEEVDHAGGVEARIALALRLESDEGDALWTGTVEGSAQGDERGGGAVMRLVQSAFGDLVSQLSGEIAAAVERSGESR